MVRFLYRVVDPFIFVTKFRSLFIELVILIKQPKKIIQQMIETTTMNMEPKF